MLVENQIVLVRWHGTNRQYYIDKGYTFTKIRDTFDVKVEDLQKGSNVKVKVKCDYCGKVFEKSYSNYVEQHDDKRGDACRDCSSLKLKDVFMDKYGVSNPNKISDVREKIEKTNLERYGVKNPSELEEIKEKRKQTFIEKYGVEHPSLSKEINDKRKQYFIDKYGVENPFQSEDVKEKIKQSFIDKYGVENPSQAQEIKEKVTAVLLEHGHVYTSKPQIELNNTLINLYGESILNYRCGKYALDSMIVVDGIKIDVEYDGSYWHSKSKERDEERNNFVVSKGFKVLRFVCDREIPSNDIIISSVNELINSNKNILIVTL